MLYQHNEKLVAPQTGMDSQNAERAARFFTLLDTLRNWMQRLKPEATSSDWANRLGNLLEDIFGEAPDEEKRLDTIRQALSDLQKTTADSKTPISLNVIRHWLTNNLTTRTDSNCYHSNSSSSHQKNVSASIRARSEVARPEVWLLNA